MAVKIEHTADGHYHDILQPCISDMMFMPADVWGLNQNKSCQYICFCPSKLIYMYIHGELNKNKFCSIKGYISPLDSLPAISINVFYQY